MSVTLIARCFRSVVFSFSKSLNFKNFPNRDKEICKGQTCSNTRSGVTSCLWVVPSVSREFTSDLLCCILSLCSPLCVVHSVTNARWDQTPKFSVRFSGIGANVKTRRLSPISSRNRNRNPTAKLVSGRLPASSPIFLKGTFKVSRETAEIAINWKPRFFLCPIFVFIHSLISY